MTNLEGRVIRRKMALPPPAGVLDDLQMIVELATRLGRGQYFSDKPAEVFEELRRASAGGIADYAGITYDRIEAEQGVFWPCPSVDHPGTPRLFTEAFPTPDGKARFIPVTHRAPGRDPGPVLPVRADHRAAAAAVPERHPDPAAGRHHGARPARAAASEPGPEVEHRGQRHGGAAHPPRGGRVPGADHRRHPSGSAVRALPLGRGVQRQLAHRARRWTRTRRCRSSRCARWPPAGSAAPTTSTCCGPCPRQPDVLPFRARASPTPTIRRGTTRRTIGNRTPTPKDTRMHTKNRFLQGIFQFTGVGIDKPAPIDETLTYLVPDGSVAQALYFRGGNTTDELITVRADARRRADAVLPDRRPLRRARAAAGRRGPERRHRAGAGRSPHRTS